MEVSHRNLLEANHNCLEVISVLEELKKYKLLVLESHCALNNNFCPITARLCLIGSQYVTRNKEIITVGLSYATKVDKFHEGERVSMTIANLANNRCVRSSTLD